MAWKQKILVIAVLSIPATATAQTIVVRTYNQFGVSADDLRTARDHVEIVLREAGIDVTWMDCWQVNQPPAGALPKCQQQRDANELLLRIQKANPQSGKHYLALGFSLVNPRDGHPFLSTVYADLVVKVARRAAVDPRRLLGLAIAHEIGHLLLNSTQHPEAGLMRADWSQSSLRQITTDDWRFLPNEVATMQTALAARRR